MPRVAELSVGVEVDGLAEAIAGLDRLEERLKRLASEEYDSAVNVDTLKAQADVGDLQMALFDLDGEQIKVPVEVPVDKPLTDIEELKAALQSIDNKIVANVDIDKAAATAHLEELRMQLLALQNAKAKVDLDITGALARIVELEAALKAMPNGKVEIKVDPDGSASSEFARLRSNASRASNSVSALWMAVFSLGLAAVPVLAAATAGVGALAAGFVASAAGAGVFAAVAMSNFGDIENALKRIDTAQKAYNLAVTDKQRDTAMKQMKAALDNLEPAQRAVAKAVLQFKDNWDAFSKKFQPGMFAMAAQGLNAMTKAIPLLTPLMNGMMTAAQNLETRLIAALSGPFWTQFFNNMSRLAGPVTESLAAAFGNIITGIAGIINAFDPFALDMSSGLEDITKKFADWGIGLANNPGFKAFIAYVKENLPKVIDFLAQLGKALVAIVHAAAPLGAALLPVVTKFLEMITALDKLNPNMLTFALAVLGIGLVIINLLGPLLNIVAVFGGLPEAMTAVLAPAGLILGAILLLVGAFILLWTQSEGFRNAVTTIWNGIKSAISTAIDGIIAGFQWLWGVIQAGWAIVKPVFDDIASTVGPQLSSALDALKTGWANLKKSLDDAWTSLSPWHGYFDDLGTAARILGQVIGILLVGIIGTAFGVIVAIISGALRVIGGIIEAIGAVVGGLATVIGGTIQLIAGLITGNWNSAWEGAKKIVEGAKAAIEGSVKGLLDALVGILQGIKDGFITAFQTVSDILVGHSIVPDMVNAIVAVMATLPGRVLAAVASLISGITTWATNVMTNAVSGFNSGLSNVISFFSGMGEKILSTIGSFVGRFFSAGASLLQSFANGIASAVGSAVSAVSSAVSAVTSLLPGSPAKTGPLSGQGYSMLRGQRMMADFATGIESGIPKLEGVAASMASAAVAALPSQRTPYAGVSGGSTTTVTVAPGAFTLQVGAGATAGQVSTIVAEASDGFEALLERLKRR